VGLVGGCGGSSSHAPPTSTSRAPARHALAFGLTELNPWVLGTGWVAALHPGYARVFVDWDRIQPDPSRPADLAHPVDGCARGTPPCLSYGGLRATLGEIARLQRAHGGWQVLMVIYGVPRWAARTPSGCERPGTTAFSRPITAAGLVAYRRLIGQILALGRRVGVGLRWWAPWNEPDHPAFISPQRAGCGPASTLVAAEVYAQLVRAASVQLAADATPHELVLGELAGFTQPSAYATTAAQFVASLPSDVACSGAVWSVHQYARPSPPGGEDPVAALERALDARACTRGKHVWVDEAGAGNLPGDTDPSRTQSCAVLAADAAIWAADPRIDVAMQYTARDDPFFPVGLADARLTHLWPSYGVWSALTAGRVPTASDCSATASRGLTPAYRGLTP
jgi:hypothetical protein